MDTEDERTAGWSRFVNHSRRLATNVQLALPLTQSSLPLALVIALALALALALACGPGPGPCSSPSLWP